MSDFLAEMAQASAARVRAGRQELGEGELVTRCRKLAPALPLRLDPRGFDLIAEVKLRSPAAGMLAPAAPDLAARVAGYARAGAAAVSVLTESSRFDGELAHLAAAAAQLAPLRIPAMRKDFLVDPYQVLEARVTGAGGVLLILRMLSRPQLDALLACACEQGLFVLLEAFDAQDLELMQELVGAHRGANQLLAGVNCRDLTSLKVVPGRLRQLAPLLPQGVPGVAESGVANAADARAVAAAGYSLALVGGALMQDADPQALAQALLAAGRAARGT